MMALICLTGPHKKGAAGSAGLPQQGMAVQRPKSSEKEVQQPPELMQEATGHSQGPGLHLVPSTVSSPMG